ncbi:MAG: nucleotidyltransferase family protein [Sulfuricaulis sp.]|uniref:nucleotidyltransferase family protein n=1 Tax=Sulfuricaulis sp. TaxID=2003553 RepID=UPI0025D97228|nr:nucleotidyltransferase family protein [Sulfuricaulis sp.]MCR4348010.1 nucleotidyltransferase family protein [Sulfuricaulis sp.]
MSLPVAVLAGGLATRLRPITEKIPKALVDVAGQPFVVRQLDYLRQQGISRVVLCLGYLGAQVEAVVGDGSAFGLDVRYSWDGPRLLGTGGALRQALPLLGEQFFIFYGDSYLPIDFRAVERDFLASGKPALMTVLKNGNQWDKSNVLFRDGRIAEYNKRAPRPEMTHIDYGLGVMSASVLENALANEPFDLADIYHELSIRGVLAGHEVFERFYEIGSHKGLDETIEYFSKEEKA